MRSQATESTAAPACTSNRQGDSPRTANHNGVRRLLLVGLVLAFVVAPARANPVTQDECPGSATVTTWKQLGNDTLENLLIDGSSLWVSDETSGAIRRFGPDGGEADAAHELAGVSSPGGLAVGPDGLIYANTGDSFQGALLRTGDASVIRFSRDAPAATKHVYASGFNMANGLTFAPNGDAYISNDVDAGLIRIPRAHPTAWSRLNDLWGTNGLVATRDGKTMYATITFDQRSPIERISLPSGVHSTAWQLTVGVVSLQPAVYANPDLSRPLVGLKGLDDMTTDGRYLYPVANGLGELLRVDPRSGAACLIASGFPTSSSVRIAPEVGPFADHDRGTIDFYVTRFTGQIMRIRYRP
jgi:virginiamycin B lyase